MRLAIEYEVGRGIFPKDYRSGILSLIKKAITHTRPELYEVYYSRWRLKPFTFAVYFPEMKGSHNGGFDVGSKLRLTISTSSLELGTHLYNGFLSPALKNYQLFQTQSEYATTLERKRISLLPATRIHSTDVVFKTASPVLVNQKRENKTDWYLLPWDDGFLDSLRFIVNETAKEFLRGYNDVSVEFDPMGEEAKKSIKRKVITHYNQSMSTMVGVFKLKSDPEVLQLIYDVGLGVRRSQGFGMLEVVKQ